MDPLNLQQQADRLFLASEAVMQAVSQVIVAGPGGCPHPSNLLDLPSPPKALTGFSRDEIDEATDFLVRLGYLPAISRGRI